jgi:hypothetical protein
MQGSRARLGNPEPRILVYHHIIANAHEVLILFQVSQRSDPLGMDLTVEGEGGAINLGEDTIRASSGPTLNGLCGAVGFSRVFTCSDGSVNRQSNDGMPPMRYARS